MYGEGNLVFTRFKTLPKTFLSNSNSLDQSTMNTCWSSIPRVRCCIHRDWAVPPLKVQQLLEQITVHSQRTDKPSPHGMVLLLLSLLEK